MQGEIDCLLVLYFLVLYTGKFVLDPELREDIGIVLIATQMLFLAFIVIRLLYSGARAVYRMCKVRYLKRQAKKQAKTKTLMGL